MKRVLYLSTIVLAGLMCSCEKTTEIDISTKVTISTSTMTVIGVLPPLNPVLLKISIY